jgi:hypothetical protein
MSWKHRRSWRNEFVGKKGNEQFRAATRKDSEQRDCPKLANQRSHMHDVRGPSCVDASSRRAMLYRVHSAERLS